MVRRQDYQAVIERYHTERTKTKNFAKLCDKAKSLDTQKISVSLNGHVFLVPFDICVEIPTLKAMLSIPKQDSASTDESVPDTSFGQHRFLLRKFGPHDEKPPEELHFDRDPIVFAAILDYVTNLELHVPRDICPKLFARDLVFWGFHVDEVELCCFSNLASFLIQQDKADTFQCFLNKGNLHSCPGRSECSSEYSLHAPFSRSALTFREKMWVILDNPQDSLYAKIYFIVMCLFILLSHLVIALSTHMRFLVKLDVSTSHKDTNGTGFNTNDAGFNTNGTGFNTNDTGFNTNNTGYNTNGTRTIIYERETEDGVFRINKYILYLEYLCTGYLWLDYGLRVIFFPDLKHFLKDFINITDGVAVISSMAKIVLKSNPWRPFHGWVQAVDILQLLRILRFLRPMSKMTCFRLVYFTLRCSYMDLLLVCALMLILSMIFSFFLYYLGNRAAITSIPQAMWFCLITMTTVGYGDVVPTDLMGMLVGSVVAVLGVIIVTMTTPIMVTNFHSLYLSSIVGQPSTFKKINSPMHGQVSQIGGASFVPSLVSLVPFPAMSKGCSSHAFNQRLAEFRELSDTTSSWGWVTPKGKKFSLKGSFRKGKKISRVSKTGSANPDSGNSVAGKRSAETVDPTHNLREVFPSLILEKTESGPHLPYVRPPLNSLLSIASRDSYVMNAAEAARHKRSPRSSLTGSVQSATKDIASRKHGTDIPQAMPTTHSTEQRQGNVVEAFDVNDSGRSRADLDPIIEKTPPTRRSKAPQKKSKVRSPSSSLRSKTDTGLISPASTKDIKLQQKDTRNFNENMTLHDSSFTTRGHRSPYVSYESSDTDIESDWSQGEGCVHALDFIPPLEKARAQTVWRRKRREVKVMRRKRSTR